MTNERYGKMMECLPDVYPKELSGSHHELLTILAIEHFKSIESAEQVDIHAMFDCFFEIDESRYKSFKDMAVLSATKNIILGKESLVDEPDGHPHMLLNDNSDMWHNFDWL